MKRIHSDVESEENSGLMKTTIVLIFSLLVMSDSSGDVEEERYEQLTDEMKNKRQKPNRILRDDEHTLETWSGMTLADTAFPPESDTHSSAWSAALISDDDEDDDESVAWAKKRLKLNAVSKALAVRWLRMARARSPAATNKLSNSGEAPK